jgi:hypothetical protein
VDIQTDLQGSASETIDSSQDNKGAATPLEDCPKSGVVTVEPVDIRREPTLKETATSPPKKSLLDKWAALGDRRRGAKAREESFGQKKSTSNCTSWRRDWGLGSSGFDYKSWARKATPTCHERRRPFLQKDWRRDTPDASKPRPPSGYDGSVDEDLDLVGGWHELHL